MYQDFKDLLSAFHAHNVKYLIVGGYAVSFHSQPRATKDLDLFIKADPANAKAAYAALGAFGAPLANLSADDMADLANSFASDGSRSPSIFCRGSMASSLMPRGRGAWKVLSTPKPDSRRFSSPKTI